MEGDTLNASNGVIVSGGDTTLSNNLTVEGNTVLGT